MLVYFLFVIISIMTRDAIAVLCYSCDSSDGPVCSWMLFYSTRVECETMCYFSTLPDQSIKRGCTKVTTDSWDLIGIKENHVCPGIEDETYCFKCDTELCNNVVEHKGFTLLFTLTGIVLQYLI